MRSSNTGPKARSDKEIRKAFEKICVPSFGLNAFRSNIDGEYTNPTMEDHWQTFQEGWESAILSLKNKKNQEFSDIFSDIVSTGRRDPRP